MRGGVFIMENITTKVTRISPTLWGCRIWYKDILCCEEVVQNRVEISSAFKGMLRILDKCGYDSKMAHSSRHRNNHMPISNHRTKWYI